MISVRSKTIAGVFIISLIIQIFLILFIDIPVEGDAGVYDTIGAKLSDGKGYVLEDGQLTMSREPAYPFFLAFIYSIFGHSLLAVKLIQIVLFLGTAVFSYKIAYLVFGDKIAKYTFVLVALFPTLISYPSFILSETLFTFLLSLLVFFCIKLSKEKKLKYYILSGVILGIVVLCKSIMFPFILVLFLWGILFCKNTPKTILMVVIAFIIVAPWMYRNYINFGTFALRDGSERALAIKVKKLDYGIQDFKKAIVFTISESLGKKVYPDAIKNPRDFLFKEDIIVREKILPELKNKGYSDKEIRKIMIGKIAKRPLKFLTVSSLDLLKMMQFSYLPFLNEDRIIESFKKLSNGAISLSVLRAIFRFLACVLILFSILGMYLKRNIWKEWIFLFVLIAYITLSYSLMYGHGRYSVPLIPYYVMLSVPTILKIKDFISNKYSRS